MAKTEERDFWDKWEKMTVEERKDRIYDYAKANALYISEGALGDCWVWHSSNFDMGSYIANADNQCKICIIRTARNRGRCPVLELMDIPVIQDRT